ncbi:MAG: histidine kinase [Acidobacteriota bacterium]|nr:histidine kinase [Acidobacteriota bacterium]
MHPITSRPDRSWVAYLAMGAAGALIGTRPLRAAGALAGDVFWFSLWGCALMLMGLGAWSAARYVTVANSSFKLFLAMAVSVAAGVGAAWFGAGFAIAVSVEPALPSVAPAFRAAWPSLWLIGTLCALAILLLQHALASSDEGEASARRALTADVASRDAELRALRAQVDPHFLFNCLHSISSMTSRDPDGARRMCLELADFFRASLKAGIEPRIPLSSELTLLRRYLDIERVRFGSRLNVEFDERGDVSGMLVPPLLLQPLVENAVRHGIATLVDGGTVRISVVREEDRVEISVENAFDPDGRRPGTGVGLTNVRERLDATFRGAATIRAVTLDQPEPVFKVSISLPSGAEAPRS